MKVIILVISCLLSCVLASDTRACTEVTADRAGLVKAAQYALAQGTTDYSKDMTLRWAWKSEWCCPDVKPPRFADCSSFVTWCYWTAFGMGWDFLNGQKWGSGYTGTMYPNGGIITKAQAQPGDLVFYGESGTNVPSHVAMYIGNDEVIGIGATKADGGGVIKMAYNNGIVMGFRQYQTAWQGSPPDTSSASTAHMCIALSLGATLLAMFV